MALHQHTHAQPFHEAAGHAARSGSVSGPPEFEMIKIGGFQPNFPKPPTFEDKLEEREYLKGRLAAAFRIVGAKGYGRGAAGHMSARDPIEKNTFWLNAFGQSFNTIRRSDLMRVDHSGNVLQCGRYKLVNKAAIMIISAVHKARPDIICTAHMHSMYACAFTSLNIPLPIITQDACAFHNDIASLPFGGIVLEGEEGCNIAAALGQKKAALLMNHGLLTCANTIEATIFWFINLEELCQMAVTSLAAVGGDISKLPNVPDEYAAETYKSVGLPLAGWFSAKPYFDDIAVETNEAYLA